MSAIDRTSIEEMAKPFVVTWGQNEVGDLVTIRDLVSDTYVDLRISERDQLLSPEEFTNRIVKPAISALRAHQIAKKCLDG